MQVDITKSETQDTINLQLLIQIAKDYASCFEETETDTDAETDIDSSSNQEKSSYFIHSLLSINNLLITYNKEKQTDFDSFILNYIEEAMGSVVLELTYVLDCIENSVFSYENMYIFKRYSTIDGWVKVLENIIEESKEDCTDRYIIINEFLTYYAFEDYTGFITILKKLLQTPRIHVICATSVPQGLTPDILSLFQYRISFFLGDISSSSIIFGSDIACTQLMDWDVVYSNDYGKTYSVQDITVTKEDIDTLLDI